jgi:hypothetical protein
MNAFRDWFSWGRASLITLFCLVFLMLFMGLFSKNSGPANTTRASSQFRVSGIAGIGTRVQPGSGKTSSAPASAATVEDLIPGDILVGRCALSPVPCLDPSDAWTHACLYVGNNRIVVSGNPRSGVIVDNLRSWMYPDMTWVAYLRVTSADDEIRTKAVQFALSKQGQPYDINWLSKQPEGESWYCSELVWAAYLDASGGAIDLQRKPDVFGVSPDEIYESPQVQLIGGHYEKKPDTLLSLMMKIVFLCILAGGTGTLFSREVPPSLITGRRGLGRRFK